MFLQLVFMFCFFLGSMAMFYYLLKKLDALTQALSDEHAQMRVLLRAMESRLDKLSQMERLSALFQGKFPPDGTLPGEASSKAEKEEAPGHDPLLHLSFEQPPKLDEPIDPGLDLNLDPPKPWDLPSVPPKN